MPCVVPVFWLAEVDWLVVAFEFMRTLLLLPLDSTFDCTPVAETLTRVDQAVRFKLHDLATEGGSRDRVDVVEVDDAVRRDAVFMCGQFEFGNESPDSASDRRHDDGSDAISDGVSREHEDRSFTARRGGEPHFTALHQPSPTSLRRVPTRRSGRSLPRRR